MVVIDQEMLAQYLETITSNGMENLDLLSILPSGEEVEEDVMIQSIGGDWVIMDMYDENIATAEEEDEPLADDSKHVTFVLIESTKEQALTLRVPLFLLYKEGNIDSEESGGEHYTDNG